MLMDISTPRLTPRSDALEADARQKARGTIVDAVEHISDDVAPLMGCVPIADT